MKTVHILINTMDEQNTNTIKVLIKETPLSAYILSILFSDQFNEAARVQILFNINKSKHWNLIYLYEDDTEQIQKYDEQNRIKNELREFLRNNMTEFKLLEFQNIIK